jgi:hypothetical protein
MRKLVIDEICKNYAKGLEETWCGCYGCESTIGAIMMNSFIDTNDKRDELEPPIDLETRLSRQKYFKEILTALTDEELLEILDRQHCECYR